MNKTAIKSFAVSARVKLIEAIEQKAYELGITKNEIKEPEIYEDGFRIHHKFFKQHEKKQRDKLIVKIKEQGFDNILEEVAYTWFNRFIAIRFMEVNEYLPIGMRMLSSIHPDKFEPDAVTEVLTIAEELELDVELIYRLQDENNSEQLFKYIFIKQCNQLGESMPLMFERIKDYTELLLPDKLLAEGSVVRDLVTDIPDDDWKEQVEIIGWLYQYYISEKKDEVFLDLKKNKKVSKENIPAATQLFTPKWIVQYMVENSLGRLWLESHPDEELTQKWNYYMGDALSDHENQQEQPPLVIENPEAIKVLDPCMGSGHILVYAFDVLYRIYKSAGYVERDIPALILEKNLYGLDIDDRAAQLSYFALMMKARSYNRRILRKKVELNICSIQDSHLFSAEVIDYFSNSPYIKNELEKLVSAYKDGKDFGSILEIEDIDFAAISERLVELQESEADDLFALQYREIIMESLPELLQQGKIMAQTYSVVVTNPPYMRRRNMNKKLSEYLTKTFLSPEDYFSAFIERGFLYCEPNGFNSMVTTQSWMFLSTYEKLRKFLIENKQFYAVLHMDSNVMISFSTVAAVWRNKTDDFSCYFTYVTPKDVKDDEPTVFPSENKRNTRKNQAAFLQLPGYVLAYWCPEKLIEAFREGVSIGEQYNPKSGIKTGNNDLFLRLWHEVDYLNIGKVSDYGEYLDAKERWFPYNKGGGNKKWYGNLEYVVNLKNEAEDIKRLITKDVYRLRDKDDYFKHSIGWPLTGSDKFSSKYIPNGVLLDVASCGIYFKKNNYDYALLGFLNSKVANEILNLINPTLSYPINSIAAIPLYEFCDNEKITEIVKACIDIARSNWDSYEQSWGFQVHPIINYRSCVTTMQEAWRQMEGDQQKQLTLLKQHEEQLNQIFIDLYDLREDFTAEVEEKDLSLQLVNDEEMVKSFLSYAVGCMVGRYSLDKEGLIFAGGEFDLSQYQSFPADADNIIPITDDEYFEDDIVTRFINFIRLVFDPETLEANLDFIADCLIRKKTETARQRLRRYFVKEFYKDHVQTYQKCPIYWLFDSGKYDGFKALMYMHRYNAGAIAKVRTDYLHTLQRKYEAELSRLDFVLAADVSPQEKTTARKQKQKIQKQLVECQQYDQVIAHVANQQIELNLDDGVKANYGAFQKIEVPQGDGKKPVKADVFAKL